jgi:hypothetical protein
MWLQGLHPKYAIALNAQPRETPERMRTLHRRQAGQLDTLERQATVPRGTAVAFRRAIGQLEFKVDLGAEKSSAGGGADGGLVEWPLLGKRAHSSDDFTDGSRVFVALNPHMPELEAAERRRVGGASFRPATTAEAAAARARSAARVATGLKVSGSHGADAPVEAAEVLRPAAEVFGVVAYEHGFYYGEQALPLPLPALPPPLPALAAWSWLRADPCACVRRSTRATRRAASVYSCRPASARRTLRCRPTRRARSRPCCACRH